MSTQCQTEFPDTEYSHSFEVVMSKGTWVKARGWRTGIPSHSGWFSRLLTFGYKTINWLYYMKLRSSGWSL